MSDGDRTDRLEERVAHLMAQVDDLSEMVAGQARAIDLLERRVALLLEREAARQDEGGGGVVLGDERPPHY
ncbi:SlyX family protein [Roseivivax sp. CAU 1761]